jgi:hypothetical protein
MDRLTQYRQCVRRILEERATWLPRTVSVKSEVIVDPASDHYELLQLGWNGRRRIHTVVFHIDIIDGKVWVQHDATDRPVVDDLLAAGIPASDIVLGFHPAELRPHTEFAVG